MASEITSIQRRTTLQTLREKYVKIELLNFEYLVVNSLEGKAIDGSISIDATSDIRRTCNLRFVLDNSSFNVQAGGQIWLDKLIKINIGIFDIITQEISWTNMGVFLINEPTYYYDASTRTMSFQGVDLMAKMTGLRNGYISELSSDEEENVIPAGNNVREEIIKILQKCGFTQYFISECENEKGIIQPIPYDIKYEKGQTWYDLLVELKDILPYYQIYFDTEGVFRYEKIPYSAEDPIMIDEEIWKSNVISEEISVNFEDVKNFVEVYGRVHDTDDLSDSSSTTINDNIITPIWENVEELQSYMILSFELPNDLNNEDGIKISFLGEHDLIDYNKEKITSLNANVQYYISYQLDDTFLFLGREQAYGVYSDTNPDSPFYINSSVGKISIVLHGDEYDNIISDDLAEQRARYEIYKRCRLNDSINLNTVPIYWADVNWKVNYTPLNSTDGSHEYIIQSIDTQLSVEETQTLNLSRFYPLYPIFN